MGEDYGEYGKSIERCWQNDNGYMHRIDGPAIIYEDGSDDWCINGYSIKIEVDKWMNKNNITYPWNEETQVQFELTFAHNDYPTYMYQPWYAPAGLTRALFDTLK